MIAKWKGIYLIPWAFFNKYMKHFQNMVKYHKTSLFVMKVSVNEMHLLSLVPKELHI